MKFLDIKSIDGLSVGDVVIITGHMYDRQSFKIPAIKNTTADGVEVILDIKQNHFFNLGMYLEKRSWVREAYKVVP